MKIFLAIGFFLMTVSVACTASRSAGSQSLVNSNASVVQSPAQTTDASAQDKPTCQLTLAGVPDIKGLRLGMTPEQVLALFPGSIENGIRVFAGGTGGNLNYVLMSDLEADKKLKDRRAKARAKATPTPER